MPGPYRARQTIYGDDWCVEREYACINGLSAWFIIATLETTNESEQGYTDSNFPSAQSRAEMIALALNRDYDIQMVDTTYINKMSIDHLRAELIAMYETHFAVIKALKDLPEVPMHAALKLFNSPSNWSIDKDLGKALQRKHGLDLIPPVSEYENGAGFWSRLRDGLKSKE